jgi:hypothetical protein
VVPSAKRTFAIKYRPHPAKTVSTSRISIDIPPILMRASRRMPGFVAHRWALPQAR